MMQSVEWILFFIKPWLQQLLPQSRCGDARGPFLMICSAYIFVFAAVFGNFICHQAGAGGWQEAKKIRGPSPTQGWGGTAPKRLSHQHGLPCVVWQLMLSAYNTEEATAYTYNIGSSPLYTQNIGVAERGHPPTQRQLPSGTPVSRW